MYIRPTSDLGTHYRLKVRGWKKIFHANGNQKKAGVAILISDKIDFKIKAITGDKEGAVHNDQGINPRRRYSTCKYLRTQHRSTSIHKANANSQKRMDHILGQNPALVNLRKLKSYQVSFLTTML